jgi:oligopeptide transport system ATP-binding protein
MGLLAGNAIYESGSIMYGGRDLMSIPEEMFHEIRGSKISMIFQDPMSSLNPIQTVGKQISEALIFKMGMTKEMAKRKAIELMEQVGIPNAEKRYNQYPFQFSGGMRQRIVISIALANNAEVIICDEPTTALDVTIQGQILELLDRLKAERNLSVIFITHDLGVVANVANRIAVMYAGKIVEIGTAEEIFYDPKHPYTWALLSSMPILATSKHLDAISGTPPNMIYPPKGDAFAPRNKYALQIDFEEEPPFFKVSDTHYAATWLLHPDAPKVEVPDSVKRLQENRGKIKK